MRQTFGCKSNITFKVSACIGGSSTWYNDYDQRACFRIFYIEMAAK